MSVGQRTPRYASVWLLAGLMAFAFCAHDILVRDTDWARMMSGHPWETLARFARPDFTLIAEYQSSYSSPGRDCELLLLLQDWCTGR